MYDLEDKVLLTATNVTQFGIEIELPMSEMIYIDTIPAGKMYRCAEGSDGKGGLS